MLCRRPPVAVPERLSLVHSPCAGLVSAGTADLVIRSMLIIDFVRPVGIMDAFYFLRSGLKRVFFLGYARHFPTSVALTAPGRNRLCLLQGLLGRGSRRASAKPTRQRVRAKTMASRIVAIFFIEKHFLSFGMLVSVSRRVLSRFIVPYCFIFSTIILFFVLIYIFSVLHQRAVCCVFCPTGVGGPTLHPCLSNFYQNVGFLPSRLIFHSLRPCRASGIYLMWESLFMKFVSFLQTEPSIYCF